MVDLVYPPRCPSCGVAVAEQGGLCVDCWSELEVPGEPACSCCQRPMSRVAKAKSEICYVCNAKPPRHSGVIAATLYGDVSRKLILTFKHGGKIALAPLLGQILAARLPVIEEGVQAPLLVPVPLHRWRLWQRGFNQAALIAKELANAEKGELLVDALVRKKQTPSLGGLGREEREAALAGAISVRKGRKELISGRDVILVDDVLTSGATSDACVAALLDNGAASVRIACFARVVDGQGLAASDLGGKFRSKSETPEAETAPGAT